MPITKTSLQRLLFPVTRPLYRARLRVLHGRERYRRPVFVVCSPRTGSQLFLWYLNGLPHVHFTHEALNADSYIGAPAGYGKEKALKYLALSVNACRSRISGAKLFFRHVLDRGMTFDDIDEAFPDARYILLYRRSFLEQFVSLHTARRTRQWVLEHGEEPMPFEGLVIDVKTLIGAFKRSWWWHRDFLHTRRHKTLVIAYEDFVADPQGTFDEKVFGFLAMQRTVLRSPRTAPQRRRPLREIVVNYGEVAALEGLTQDYERDFAALPPEITAG